MYKVGTWDVEAYLVVGLDVELNLLAGEGSYSVVLVSFALPLLLPILQCPKVFHQTYLICILSVLLLLQARVWLKVAKLLVETFVFVPRGSCVQWKSDGRFYGVRVVIVVRGACKAAMWLLFASPGCQAASCCTDQLVMVGQASKWQVRHEGGAGVAHTSPRAFDI